LKLYFCNKL